MALSKTSSSSFLDFVYSSSFKFFDAVLSILKPTSFNLLEHVQHHKYVAFKWAKKCDWKMQLYIKKGTQIP